MDELEDLTLRLRAEFLDEASYLLESCEEALLLLEDSDSRDAALDDVFRVAHTIKGSGAVVGLRDLVELAHAFEDCLVALRTNSSLLTTALTTLMLKAVDALKARVSELKKGEAGEWHEEVLLADLRAAAAQMGVSSAMPGESKASERKKQEKDQENAAAGFGFFDMEPPLAPKKALEPAPGPSLAVAKGAPSARNRHAVATSVKVDSDRIDGLLDAVGELVVVKSQLLNKLIPYAGDLGLQAVAGLVDSIVKELQDRALGIRMTPLKPAFQKLQRLVRDLSLQFNKAVEFSMSGEDTELDRSMVESLADPLLHVMRNAVDHGIEKKDVRAAAGKPPMGHIKLTARQAGGRVVIEIKDDGGGIRRDKVYQRAVERGIIAATRPLADIPDKEIFALMFAPGFSTAEVVSEISGRGVGLDVVKNNIERLKGSIEIVSELGCGSTFILSIPLTTSITDGILLTVSGQAYVVPLDRVLEMVAHTPNQEVEYAPGVRALRLRERIIPTTDLRNVLGNGLGDGLPEGVTSLADRRGRMVIIVQHDDRMYGLVVDAVVGQMQVVLKPMSTALPPIEGVTGAAVMGDGRVALVLDVGQIVMGDASNRRNVG